jgi:predicted dehydrogenase
MIAFVCGDPGFESVAAFHANVAHPLQPEREDIGAVTLRLRTGALATASIDYLRPLSAATHGDDGLRVVGTRGSLEVAFESGCLTILDEAGSRERRDFPPATSFYPEFLHRLQTRGRGEVEEETRRSFALTDAALCARDAADQGEILRDLRGPWDGEPGPIPSKWTAHGFIRTSFSKVPMDTRHIPEADGWPNGRDGFCG